MLRVNRAYLRILELSCVLALVFSCIVPLQSNPIVDTQTNGRKQTYSATVIDSLSALSIIPIWTRSIETGVLSTKDSVAMLQDRSSEASCPEIISSPLTDEQAAVRTDTSQGLTQIFCGDIANNRIVMHSISRTLVHSQVPLPIPYGVAWVAEDLDRDGDYSDGP